MAPKPRISKGKAMLSNFSVLAVERAKKLQKFQNPSTGIYKLIEMLKGEDTAYLKAEGLSLLIFSLCLVIKRNIAI